MIEVLEAGPQTTVQDLGRFGHLRSGIPPSGPMDRFAFVLANRLAGNEDGAAGLECTLVGPRFRTDAACAIAVTGAEMALTVNGEPARRWWTVSLEPGDIVKIGPARAGVRGYVAFSGGIDVPLVLGSRSTYLRGGLGGYAGRALRRSDRIELAPAKMPKAWQLPEAALPAYTGETEVRIVLGPQAERFTERGITALLRGRYEMLPQSDRMGARLRGAPIEHSRGHDIVSDGIALGSIQVAGDGQPIVLLADRQSTGGYTKIATVCSFDVARIAQTRPGQFIRFAAVDIDEAHRLYRLDEERLAALTREA